MGEFDLIERIRSRTRSDRSVRVGIGDDAAVVAPSAGTELVATTDSFVLDRHFTADWPPADIGDAAAQANLSDLAAMAARPRWALLALTLPDADPTWLDGFLDGFLGALDEAGMQLVGGNLSSGPLNIGVQMLGEIPAGRAVTRTGARAGDRLVVTGTLGDAAAALALGEKSPAALTARLRHPRARVAAGAGLRDIARAMIDVSDGLMADLQHLLSGGLGAELDLDALPASDALIASVPDPIDRWRFQAAGGSDYELLAVVPESAETRALAGDAGTDLTVIGRINASGRIDCRSSRYAVPEGLATGWDHFRHD